MDKEVSDFWQSHSIKYLEMAFRTDKQEIIRHPDGYGKKTGGCGDTAVNGLTNMKMPFNLSKHCIETETKRMYEESLTQYFRAPDSKRHQLEEKIEGLKNFLEYSDFNLLRNSHPFLAGTEGGKADLHLLGRDLFEIEIDGSFYRPQKKTVKHPNVL